MRLPNIFEGEMLRSVRGAVEACAEDPNIKISQAHSSNRTSAGMHARGHYCTMHKTVIQRLQFNEYEVHHWFNNSHTTQKEDKLRKTNVKHVQRTNADISRFPSIPFFYRFYSLDVLF